MRLLVTGTQRSGTRYLATVLADAGVDATHEGNRLPARDTRWREHDPREAPRTDVDVDVCWHSAWWLGSPQLAGVRVIHLVREPLAVISSSVSRGTFWQPHPSGRWAMERFPEIRRGDNVERCARYWVLWNEMVEPRAHVRLRVEDVTASEIAGMLDDAGVAYDLNEVVRAIDEVSRRVNAHQGDRVKVGWDDLRPWWHARVATAAVRYGYDAPETAGVTRSSLRDSRF